MVLNDCGKIIVDNWEKLPQHFPTIEIDIFNTMPNHFHGIIKIVGAPLVGVLDNDINKRAAIKAAPTLTLGDIMGAFKSITTNEYIRNGKNNNWLTPKR